MRHASIVGVWLGLLGLCGSNLARADAPPMPPCPPGWEQVDAYSCREPFQCPPGWKLDRGPICVPWECEKATDCNWKGYIPCKEAEVCAASGKARAVRVCDSAAGNAACPAGLSCQKRKLCANFSALAMVEGARFGNWTPGSTLPAPVSKAPPAPPPAAVAPTDPVPAATSAAASPEIAATPAASKPRSACSYADQPSPQAALPWGLLALVALWTLRRSIWAADRRESIPRPPGAAL